MLVAVLISGGLGYAIGSSAEPSGAKKQADKDPAPPDGMVRVRHLTKDRTTYLTSQLEDEGFAVRYYSCGGLVGQLGVRGLEDDISSVGAYKVIGSSPPAGTEVKKGADIAVYLELLTGRPETCDHDRTG